MTTSGSTLASLVRQASPEAVRLAVRLLEGDVATQAWVEQVGFCLTQAEVAALLGRSEQAVSKDSRLLRLPRRDGRPAYPAFQFDGRHQVPGLADVVGVLVGPLQPATVAAWLTGAQPTLGGRRPVDALRDGDAEAVVTVARRLAERASH